MLVPEIANSDLDGDLYWVCNNEQARILSPTAVLVIP
jgi:hypothetical protein